jgi:5-methylcytosine-specific restriction enzyme A
MRTKTTVNSRELVKASDICEAAKMWDAGFNPYGFGKSVKYDVLIEAKLYPPKAICGIAYKLVTGKPLKPEDFPGAKDGPWHTLLKKRGFPVVSKALPELDEESADEDLPQLNKLTTEQLRSLATVEGKNVPVRRLAKVQVFERSRYVRLLALRLADGKCASCKECAPFLRKSNGEPYLEVHHIVPLSCGGEDTEKNTEALCPNCHRERHDNLGLREGGNNA